MINSSPLNKLLNHLVHTALTSQCVFLEGGEKDGEEEARGSSASDLLDTVRVTPPFSAPPTVFCPALSSVKPLACRSF